MLNKNSKNLKKFYLQVLKHSKKKEILLEEFIEGDQLSTETLIYKNKAFTVGISDRNYDKLFGLQCVEFFDNVKRPPLDVEYAVRKLCPT